MFVLDKSKKNIKRKYPFSFQDKELHILEQAYLDYLTLLSDFLKHNKIDDETAIELKSEFDKVFSKEKSKIYLNKRIGYFTQYIRDMLNLISSKPENAVTDEAIDYVKLTYKKNFKEIEYEEVE